MADSDSDLSEELFGVYDPSKSNKEKPKKVERKPPNPEEAAIEKQKINPDVTKIETTRMLAARLNKSVHEVYHDTNWSQIFDLTNDTEWKFNPRNINKFLANNDAFTIPLLSPIECKKLIELTELYQYEDCGYFKSYRSNTRIITNDTELSNKLYQRILQFMPKTYKLKDMEWEIYGLNERIRWCKYVTGQHFGTHCDAVYYKNLGQRSFYTVNIYLNKGGVLCNDDNNDEKQNDNNDDREFKGGRTQFFDINQETGKLIKEPVWSQNAEVGLAVIFNQSPEEINHNGELVLDGKKYLMRTDVMYKVKSVK